MNYYRIEFEGVTNPLELHDAFMRAGMRPVMLNIGFGIIGLEGTPDFIENVVWEHNDGLNCEVEAMDYDEVEPYL